MTEDISKTAPEKQPLNVLIVDDDATTRMLLKKTVEGLSMPCNIMEAADGDMALELAHRKRPDLVLLDIILPGSSASGVLVCKELCRDPHTKVVIVSGQPSQSIVQTCLQMGAIEYIRKPFSVEELRANLERWLAE